MAAQILPHPCRNAGELEGLAPGPMTLAVTIWVVPLSGGPGARAGQAPKKGGSYKPPS